MGKNTDSRKWNGCGRNDDLKTDDWNVKKEKDEDEEYIGTKVGQLSRKIYRKENDKFIDNWQNETNKVEAEMERYSNRRSQKEVRG